ncbi:MAG: GYD domain-containing protein [Deltaproteobacteria bacterium]|nr:GYD domain-containing protein [Deltaproteobacteria bacterium]
MPTYMMMVQLTEKGIAGRKGFPERIENLKKAYGEAGVEFKAAYHTMGPYDGIQIVEAPNALAVQSLH